MELLQAGCMKLSWDAPVHVPQVMCRLDRVELVTKHNG